MKKSITARLFVYTTGLVGLILVLFLVLNSIYFEKYYIDIKRGQLEASVNDLEGIVSEAASQNELYEEVSRLEEERGLKVYIMSHDYRVIYPSAQGRGMMGQGRSLGVSRSILQALAQNQHVFGIYEHPVLGVQFLTYAKTIDEGDVVLVQSPMGAVKESVKASQQFSVYVSLAALALGLAGSYIMARSIAIPIKKIGTVAQSVEKLDFTKKYEGERKDEIGRLGESINSMAESLESTIESLNSANSKLKVEIEKEKKIDSMRKEFISSVSHELKTPLALIQGYSEGLRDNVANEDRKNFYCDVIQDETRRMSGLVGELLELSRLESEKADMTISDFDMGRLARDVAKRHSLIAQENKISIRMEQEGDDFTMSADRDKIERALLNYIQNAVKNVESGGVVKIFLEDKGDSVRVGVYNSGSGIPEKEMEMIWNSFYKIDKARSRSAGGSGLGLSIVREIVKMHSGSYGALNRDGGVEFWMEIPKTQKKIK